MKKILIIFSILGVLMIFTALLGEVSVAADFGTSSAEFLNIGVGGRASGLGGAYTAVANDVTAGYWNPAGLTDIQGTQIGLSHISWYQDISYEYVGLARKVNDKFAIGATVTYLNFGSIDGYDITGMPTGEVGATFDMMLGLSMGYRLIDNMSAGLTLKYINISLADYRASSYAADFGLKYSFGSSVSIGFAAQNFGQKLKFEMAEEDLPSSIRIGGAISPFGNSLMTAIDFEKQIDGELLIRNGIELNYNQYFLRGGYTYIPGADEDPLGQGFTFGAGAIMGPAQFDYTYSPDNRLGDENLHCFSIVFSLGQ